MGELQKRIWELLEKASELEGNSPSYCYPFIKEIVGEMRKEFPVKFLHPPVVDVTIPDPVSVGYLYEWFVKWFADEE